MSVIGRYFDKLLGRGGAAVTVPVMDGPFLPNQKLELAELVWRAPDVDNLMAVGGQILATSADRLIRLTGSGSDGNVEVVEKFAQPIASAAVRREG